MFQDEFEAEDQHRNGANRVELPENQWIRRYDRFQWNGKIVFIDVR